MLILSAGLIALLMYACGYGMSQSDNGVVLLLIFILIVGFSTLWMLWLIVYMAVATDLILMAGLLIIICSPLLAGNAYGKSIRTIARLEGK